MIEEGFVTVSEDQDNRQQEAKVLLARILEYFDENDDEQSVDDSLDLGTKVLLEVKHKGYHYKLVQYQPALPPPSVQLSPREDEIVRMVAQGLPNKGIASVLDISPWTVATHLRRVFNKLGVRSRAEMVACVMENNLLEEA